MTSEEVLECQDLITAHNALRWNLARNGHSTVGLWAIDDDENTTQPRLPPPIGRQVMLIALSLVEARLRELGVEPDGSLEHDCFECGGSGKRPMR